MGKVQLDRKATFPYNPAAYPVDELLNLNLQQP